MHRIHSIINFMLQAVSMKTLNWSVEMRPVMVRTSATTKSVSLSPGAPLLKKRKTTFLKIKIKIWFHYGKKTKAQQKIYILR